jgi:hypothetical protein
VCPKSKNPGKCSTIEPAERDVEVPPTIDRNYGDSAGRLFLNTLLAKRMAISLVDYQ